MRFYEGVVELSLTAAEKKDPQGLGLHFYKNGEPEEDVVGLQAFQERQVCRIICVLSLEQKRNYGKGTQNYSNTEEEVTSQAFPETAVSFNTKSFSRKVMQSEQHVQCSSSCLLICWYMPLL